MGQSAITGINLGVPAFILPFVDGDLSAGVLTVNHNLNAQYLSVTVYNNSNQIVIPDQITATSVNACTIDLTSYGTLTGTYRVVVLDSGATMNSVASDLSLAGQTVGDRIIFDGSNWVRQATVAFRAIAGATQSFGPSVITIAQCNTETFDTHGYFDTSTYRFTPLVAGYYLVHGYWRMVATNIDREQDSWIYKNGALYGRNTTSHVQDAISNNTYSSGVITEIVYLNGSTDYVDFRMSYSEIGGATSLSPATNDAEFKGFLIA